VLVGNHVCFSVSPFLRFFLCFFVSLFLCQPALCLQEAERKIPINYASRYKVGALSRQSYLPFKVNATGVMPVIFSSSLLAVPAGVARFTNSESLVGIANALAPGGPAYLPTNIALIVAFNYYYTFLQLDPNDLSDQLKRGVCSFLSLSATILQWPAYDTKHRQSGARLSCTWRPFQ
jgi:preprotein translocase subunit SecY